MTGITQFGKHNSRICSCSSVLCQQCLRSVHRKLSA